MSTWWTGLPPAEATVECSGHTHTLRWQAGALTAIDHGDPEDEATLAALAGQSFACLELLRAWARRRNDPRVLTLASRGPTDPLNINVDHPWHQIGPSRRTETELLRLLALGGALPDRLQAHAAATWARRLRAGHAALAATRPQLHAALYGRVLATLRTWLGEPNLTIELAMTEAKGEPRLVRTKDAIAVSLPFAWLPEVWVRGIAVTFGRLCVAAETADGYSWTLQTLGPDLTDLTNSRSLPVSPRQREPRRVHAFRTARRSIRPPGACARPRSSRCASAAGGPAALTRANRRPPRPPPMARGGQEPEEVRTL